jgi:hypothetical protein
LRAIILFEPPGSALGLAPTDDYVRAFAGVDRKDERAFAEAFKEWIFGNRLPSQESSTPTRNIRITHDNPVTIIQASWEPSQVVPGFAWKLASTVDEISRLSRHALSSTPSIPGDQAANIAKPIGLGLIYGSATIGYCLDAADTVQKLWTAGKVGSDGTGKAWRQTASEIIPGADHFAHVDRAHDFAQALVALLTKFSIVPSNFGLCHL